MKCMVIGIDGASYHLVKKWADDYELPNLKSIMDNGVYGILKSTIPANTCPALPAFYTGKNPAKIGIFNFTKPDGTLVTTKDIKDPTLWDLLSLYGFKQCIAGLRATYPPPKIHGVFISGILDPTEDSDFVYPKEKKENYKNFYPADFSIDKILKLGKNREKNKYKIYNILLDITRKQVLIFREMMKKERPNFGLLWIGHTDTIQHYFWDNKELILKFFREIDSIIGELIQSHPNTNVIIISDHGFGEAPRYEFYLNSWLAKEGYLKVKWGRLGSVLISLVYTLLDFLSIDLNKIIRKIYIFKLNNYKKLKGNNKVLDFPRMPGIDYTKSLACYGTAWGIKILKENVKDYEELRNEIIKKLKELRGVEGDKLIKEVWRREDIYRGKYEEDVPDIIFVINDRYLCRAILKRKIFSKIRKRNWVGNHDSARDGIFIAFGPDIRNDGKFIGEIQIYDLMPTILHMYGVPIPDDVDGKVLMEIFNERSEIRKRKPLYTKITREKTIISARIKELKRLGKI